MGWYRAVVVDISDPQGLGRARLNVPQLFGGSITDWALPVEFVRGIGATTDTKVGDMVWSSFEGEDTTKPIFIPWVKAL